GVFGDLDVLPEQIARESGTIPYAALLLFDAEYLHASTVAPLQQWIADGGILICDRLPTKTHRNQSIVWQDLGKPLANPDGLRTRALGKGRIVFLPENPEISLQALAEAKKVDPPALATHVQQLANWIEAAAGPMPIRITVKDLAEGEPCVDTVVASLRGNDKQRLLTIVNHRSVPVEATIFLDDLKAWRYRDALAKAASVQSRKNTLTVELSPRGHRVLLGRAR
ncbi:MAG: hypothetical protein HN380_21010, partial [Victivallales bacterium]|nr:hypothetical protein [Victivallales bacterium]